MDHGTIGELVGVGASVCAAILLAFVGLLRYLKQAIEGIAFDAIIIGSGVGGLTAGAILARAGRRVLVLEQHDIAGGCLHAFEEEGFEFEPGVHYVGGNVGKHYAPLRRIFDAVTNFSVDWARIPGDHDVAVIGDKKYGWTAGRGIMRDRLLSWFPGNQLYVHTFYHLIDSVEATIGRFFAVKLLPWPLKALLRGVLRAPFYALSDSTLSKVTGKLTRGNKTFAAVLSYLGGDYGLPPATASFAIHACTLAHYADGAFYPVGGPLAIVRGAVGVIEAAGGRVLVRAEVEHIIVEGGAAVGVEVRDKGAVRAPIVISDAGVYNTFTRLLPPDVAAASCGHILADLRPGGRVAPAAAHLTLFVGLNGDAAELGLPTANYWCFANDDLDGLAAAYDADPRVPPPFVFISCPCTRDPTWPVRFPGKSNAIVIVEARHEWFAAWEDARVKHRGAEYEALKAGFKDRLLRVLLTQFPTLRAPGVIAHASVGSPLSSAYYLGSARGASYGIAHTPARFHVDWLEPATPVRGLYLAGQDIATCGVAGGAIGGVLAAMATSNRVALGTAGLLVEGIV